jgi:uncharacterized Zn ribbon protein
MCITEVRGMRSAPQTVFTWSVASTDRDGVAIARDTNGILPADGDQLQVVYGRTVPGRAQWTKTNRLVPKC